MAPGPLPKGRIPTMSLSRSRDKFDMRFAMTNHLETLYFLRTFIRYPACSRNIMIDKEMSKFKAAPVASITFEALEKSRIVHKKLDR
jgi:hypothetical protein